MLPRFRRGAFALFALTFVVTLLLGDRGAVAEALTLEPGAVLGGARWWTPLTTMFRYPEGLGLLGLVLTLLVQWGLGSRLEGFWGTTRYLLMIAVAGLLGYASTLALALALPEVGRSSFAGASPLDTAAAVAFAIVFARERVRVGSAELAPAWVGGIAATLALAFPAIVEVVAGWQVGGGLAPGRAWPALVPGAVAGVVAVVFVQPWRKRTNSGKVGRDKARAHPHLRVVRTPEDMLN